MDVATQRVDVEGPVAPYHDKEAWLEVHRTGLGGSDAAAVCGYDDYRSAADVYDAKTGIVDTEIEDPSGDLRRGVKQEPTAAERYTEVTGNKIRRQPLRKSPEHEWMLCDIDRQVLNQEEPTLLELKVPRTAKWFEVAEEGLPKAWILQLHHNMICWGYRRSEFGVYCVEYDQIVTFPVTLDEELAAWMIERERTFWKEFVEKGIRPPEPWEVAEEPHIPTYSGDSIEVRSEAWYDAAKSYRVADAKIAFWEAQKQNAKARLLELAGSELPEDALEEIPEEAKEKHQNSPPLKAHGHGVKVTRYWNRGRRRFVKNAFKNDHPDIDLEPYHARSAPYPVEKVTIQEPVTVGWMEADDAS